MKRMASILMVALVLMGGIAVAGDEEVTLEGTVVCGKCTLGEEDRSKCQNVLVVGEGDDAQHFYMAMTASNKEFGDVCMKKTPVRATGTVEEKGGQTWLHTTKIEPVKKG